MRRTLMLMVLSVVLGTREADAQILIQLLPTETNCSPSGGFLYCTDRGSVVAAGLAVGTYARHIWPLDQNSAYLDMFYGPGKPGCGPVSERVVISLLPPIAAFGEYLHLEAVTFGRPGSAEVCAALGVAGVGIAQPAGTVTITSPAFRSFRGMTWTHPSLQAPNLILLQ